MKRFKKAYIEITNSCNLNCSFCPKTNRKIKFMNLNEYEYVLNSIKPFVNFLYLHLMGEPFMHPNLKEILKISNNHNMKINITTNGTLIKKCEEILLDNNYNRSIRKISFSIHSFEGNNNEEIIDDSLKEYLDNILKFSIQFAKPKKTIVLKLWNIDSTNIDVEDKKGKNKFNDGILKYIFFYLFSNTCCNYDDCENKFLKFKKELLEKRNLKLIDNIYIQLGEKFEWPIQTNAKYNFDKILCYGGIDQFGILANGDVVPCCLDNEGLMNFGNVFERNFEDIIKGDEFKNFYNEILSGICPSNLCKKCTYARRRVNNEFK